MKMVFDEWVNRNMDNKTIVFDSEKGILYYRPKFSRKLCEFTDQSRKLAKLERFLDNYVNDNGDVIFAKELHEIRKRVKKSNTSNKRNIRQKNIRITRKIFGIFA
jgi:hypothetical protein